MKTEEIRRKYLEYFKSKGHQIVDSAPMVIKNDPTLMFTNAGMNQFKEYFLGNTEAKEKRIADTQKCLRVSGKHNDLEEVGVDTYHHTMFEMLGNWSFGDYFKEEAIDWAWDLLTNVYGLDKERLYITVFEGDDKDGVPVDQESIDFWKKHVPESRILKCDKKDNFWEMGDTGPCGPCSEIHMDIRSQSEIDKIPGRDMVNQDHPQVIEIWNLVFMQFNRKADGSLELLPEKHVDTGMGLERLAMVIQGVTSNYDTDIFQALIKELEKISGKKYGQQEKTDIAFRVIADHIRAIAFSITDGQLPSNTGAGYVIRRILRRAIRYGYQTLELKEPFINQLVPTLVEMMSGTFTELKTQQDIITKVILEEELSFFRTLEQGLKLINDLIENTKKEGSSVLSGEKVFELYDTFGFPVDLTSLIARENGLSVDEKGFETELQKQKERSRKATSIESGDWTELISTQEEVFTGYDHSEEQIKIVRYRKVKQKNKEFFQMVFDKTPFYAEGGGQVGDSGYIEKGGEKTFIFDTKRENNLIVHFAEKLPTDLNAEFHAVVNSDKRKLTARNHSATHLLHHALRTILGEHVEQKGSLVNSEYLRFDFSHFSKMEEEEIEKVESMVNSMIEEAIGLNEYRQIAIEEAKAKGAMALFGEKYGDTVRMIQFGDSRELCGGIHVQNTAEIRLFKIKSESAIAAGIRRIEAITSEKAIAYFEEAENIKTEVAELLKNPKDVVKSVQELLDKNNALAKEIEKLKAEKAGSFKKDLADKIVEVNGVNFLGIKTDLDAGSVKNILFQLKAEKDNLFAIIGTEEEGKAVLSIAITDDLVANKDLDAGKIVRDLAGKHIQGGGGGQKFFATAGGKNAAGLQPAIEEAKTLF
ncbi:MAG: alanine--tRNA ligase [Crocinitomicaceae bacterium]|nr:alanine--tRNA ligase [Crocinitomicaceae bacterium]